MRRAGKWFEVLALVATVILAAGCDSESKYGRCVGIAQSDRRDPTLIYELSTWNIFWGIVGSPLIFPPILVLHHETYCPTGRRTQPGPSQTNLLGETTTR